MWRPHALEAGVLGNSVSVKGEISPLQMIQVSWEFEIMTSLQNRFPGNQQIASHCWSFCTPWAPIAFLISTEASLLLLQTDSGIVFASAKWLILTGFPTSKAQMWAHFFLVASGGRFWEIPMPFLSPSEKPNGGWILQLKKMRHGLISVNASLENLGFASWTFSLSWNVYWQVSLFLVGAHVAS